VPAPVVTAEGGDTTVLPDTIIAIGRVLGGVSAGEPITAGIGRFVEAIPASGVAKVSGFSRATSAPVSSGRSSLPTSNVKVSLASNSGRSTVR
jgi:hypothetical protein